MNMDYLSYKSIAIDDPIISFSDFLRCCTSSAMSYYIMTIPDNYNLDIVLFFVRMIRCMHSISSDEFCSLPSTRTSPFSSTSGFRRC